VQTDPLARQYYGRPPLREALTLPAGAQIPARKYLDWHRRNVFAALAGHTNSYWRNAPQYGRIRLRDFAASLEARLSRCSRDAFQAMRRPEVPRILRRGTPRRSREAADQDRRWSARGAKGSPSPQLCEGSCPGP